MEQVVVFIQEVGFPIAAAIGLGWFIYKLVIRIVDGMEAKLDAVVEKLEQEGVDAKDSIKDIQIGSKVAATLNMFGINPNTVQQWLGIEECGCKKRQKFLNGVLSFLKGVPKEEN